VTVRLEKNEEQGAADQGKEITQLLAMLGEAVQTLKHFLPPQGPGPAAPENT
jgi:hypothetical protein